MSNRHKQHKIYLWQKIPVKLEWNDMDIDIGEIKHASIKMKTTGKISRKVLRKWRKRDYAQCRKGSCRFHGHKCLWVPASVFATARSKEMDKLFSRQPKFHWACVHCHCVCDWVWQHELTKPMLNAFKQYTRNMDDYDQTMPPWLEKALKEIECQNKRQ